MPIQTLARKEVVTTGPDASVEHVAKLMRDESVGSVVITEDERPVGIVTDRDLTNRVLADGIRPDSVAAGDVMTSDLHTVGQDTGFYEAAELMGEHGIRRLPVCSDEDDTLLGIITVDDLNELLSDEHEQLATVLQEQRPAY